MAKVNPVTWAAKLADNLGVDEAIRVAAENERASGAPSQTANANFYRNAVIWLRKSNAQPKQKTV